MSANVSILGNLGRDPKTSVALDGSLVANFSIASHSIRQTPTGTVRNTDWFRVMAFGKQAEIIAKYVKKGSRLLIYGQLTFNPWLDRTGTPQVGAELLLRDFQFVDAAEATDKGVQAAAEPAEYTVETEIMENVQEISDQVFNY